VANQQSSPKSSVLAYLGRGAVAPGIAILDPNYLQLRYADVCGDSFWFHRKMLAWIHANQQHC